MPFCALHERDAALALLRRAAPLPRLSALCTSETAHWSCCVVPRRCRAFLRPWRARQRAGVAAPCRAAAAPFCALHEPDGALALLRLAASCRAAAAPLCTLHERDGALVVLRCVRRCGLWCLSQTWRLTGIVARCRACRGACINAAEPLYELIGENVLF
ncbi:uncharacterized protein [Maniola hyperantus]|uniref:uncharacterized protein n=1 Tax=Aphantopus hyperantus TaxID=2795564 RepID=UPI003747C50E